MSQSDQPRRSLSSRAQTSSGLLRQFKPEISHDWLAQDPRPDYAPPFDAGSSSAAATTTTTRTGRGGRHASGVQSMGRAIHHSTGSGRSGASGLGRMSCPECLRLFENAVSMERHLKSHHDEASRSNMKCPHCSEEIKHRTNLHRHIRIKHDEQTGKFHCRKCSVVTATEGQLERHKEKHRRCPFCKVIMESGTGLARHTQNCRYRPRASGRGSGRGSTS